MHELGIVFHIIKTVERVGTENKLTMVSTVTLELGEVSGVVPEELTACWAWAVKKTELMKEARLAIETIPALTFCESCQETYQTVRYGRICPFCGSEQTYLVQGNEINLKTIEAC
ncbi:MAG TPA: hydrogenase maturation nickel metallochaperone HypA [Firmicutes bacterium]|uniref:Hydrogenase maturation factor HypA n=1 Tax=Capillibacterium thermochitinicola TaxID=2699427 RepID=A0A8J6I3P9_9FIRM|nr:hydrogenase maturation nickel metallochaperone HypA [Capillibacterium thermochitinicola]MBA2133672.1 hydrogenase maturation nickel metallochaperone HypA [Capillibacterium thermochitinicola]HHW11606.1 hydrogenase maturation nickel metallochaperone HypA [Bacillota bacterium]